MRYNKNIIIGLVSVLTLVFATGLASANSSTESKDTCPQKNQSAPSQKCAVVLNEDPAYADLNSPYALHGFMRARHHRIMQHLFEELFGEGFDSNIFDMSNFSDVPNWNYPGSSRRFFPDCNLKETKNGYVLTMELPGIPKSDIKISLDDNILSVSGEKRESATSDSGSYKRIERNFGAFKRSFILPDNADTEKLNASCKDGILTIDIPKIESKKPEAKVIPVK